ncbi:MAG: 50S ribosomal protein L23 [Patescibacteria group bacterium]|nr:50S ribosomal protein L23 [Patescibacteria group bacterium]
MSLLNVFKKHPATEGSQKSQPAVPAKAKAAETSVASKERGTGIAVREDVAGVLVSRIVTEKAGLQEAAAQYTFMVSPQANKITVQRAIRQRYGVKPVAVRISNVRGRRVRYGRVMGQTKAWKKAVVQLPEGTKIEGEKATH